MVRVSLSELCRGASRIAANLSDRLGPTWSESIPSQEVQSPRSSVSRPKHPRSCVMGEGSDPGLQSFGHGARFAMTDSGETRRPGGLRMPHVEQSVLFSRSGIF
jgi:hypothetical protein